MKRASAGARNTVPCRTRRLVGAGLTLLALGGCRHKGPDAASTEPPRNVASSASDRRALSLTIYNSNVGLVRERRAITLGEGRVALDYKDVAALLQPETVHVRTLAGRDDLTVLEQNYRYDLLSPETLLKKYVGKTLRVIRYNEKLGREEEKTAEVLATEQGAVLRIDGEITYGVPGRLSFPKLPEELVAKPTLIWLLDSQEPQQELEVSYLTRGMNWSADYVLRLGDDDASADLTGWVSLSNESGASFEAAKLQLVAGNVQRLPQDAPEEGYAYDGSFAVPQRAPAPSFKQEELFEYHLYTLDQPTTVRDKEKKQVTLLSAASVPVKKKLVLNGAEHLFRAGTHPMLANQKVRVELEWQNDEKSKLGMPLPQGVVRVYKTDRGGSSQFVGEDRIEHTPRDEKVAVSLGEAFDVVADRKEVENKVLSSCVIESEWRVELRNHKDSAEVVEVTEPVGGDYEVLSSTLPARRESARSFVFTVPIGARGKTELGYRVRVRYCADPPRALPMKRSAE